MYTIIRITNNKIKPKIILEIKSSFILEIELKALFNGFAAGAGLDILNILYYF
jgi:hypothetical protein